MYGVTGADVTHPVGFNPNSPSVAAAVGSLDPYLSCFGAQIMLQGHRVELLLVRHSCFCIRQERIEQIRHSRELSATG